MGDHNVRVLSSATVTDVPPLWGILLMDEVMHGWGKGAYGKSLYLSLNFVVNVNYPKNRMSKK